MKRLLIVFAVLGLGLIALPQPVAAASPLSHMAACSSGIVNFLGLESWDSCLKQKYGTAKIMDLRDVWLIAIPLLDTAIKIAGYMAVGFVIWGGIKYIKSQGEPSEVNAARMIITNALMGLIMCVLSVAIVQFVASGIS